MLLINTNLRHHEFEILANGRYTDPELANVPECSHWKRRWHPELTQATTTTIEEAERMEAKLNRSTVLRPA
jgi:hypothetical protein